MSSASLAPSRRRTATRSAVCVRAPVLDGALPALRDALGTADADVVAGNSALAGIDGLHFARWLIVPGDPSLAGGGVADTLVYTADVDGSVDNHLRLLDDRAGALLDDVFGHCVGYPTTRTSATRPGWLRAHRISNAATYVNVVGLTVPRITVDAQATAWLQQHLDAHRGDLMPLRPSEIHQRLRTAAAGSTAAAALQPAGPEPLLAVARRWLTLVLAVIILLVLLPLEIVIGIPALLAIRIREGRDPSDTKRPDREQVARLRSREDAFALNPFGALGVVKPGLLRAGTVKVVLLGISVVASCVFTRGSLAGVTTIHAARWVPLDGGRRMIFTSCYDGSLESYMNDFIDKLAWGLNVVFSNGVGYPRTRWLILDGARDEQTFKDYLRCHQLETAVAYAAHPSLTAANIRTNAVIRRGLAAARLNDRRAAEWLALL